MSLLVRALELYGYKANESTIDVELLYDYEIQYDPKSIDYKTGYSLQLEPRFDLNIDLSY